VPVGLADGVFFAGFAAVLRAVGLCSLTKM
jgi:hypothetical protein